MRWLVRKRCCKQGNKHPHANREKTPPTEVEANIVTRGWPAAPGGLRVVPRRWPVVSGGLAGRSWERAGRLQIGAARENLFGSSTSSSWRILEALGGSRSLQNQDSSALSVSGRLTNHDLSCLSVSGGVLEWSEVTIYRAWRCLEASQAAPAWRLDVFWSSTSSSWRILEALGGSRSLQNQDSSALFVSGRLTSRDLSCLSVFGGCPGCYDGI